VGSSLAFIFTCASMVLGVRVHGENVENVDNIKFDDNFRAVPIPCKLGIPLMIKKMSGTGGDDSGIRNNIIVRFMADPEDGFAPLEWQYGGRMGPAPPVLLARRDKMPFSQHDWSLMDQYIQQWLDMCSEADDDRSQVNACLTPDEFKRFVCSERELHPNAFLAIQFPLGSFVIPKNLNAADLNGQEGEVVQFSRERVGVMFADNRVLALRPEKLEIIRGPPCSTDVVHKHLSTDGARQHRAEQIQRKEALVISQRFVECLHQDTFPEMDDLHLFGIGGDYRARAQEVLAVWQGAVKNGDITENMLANALLDGSIKELFNTICHNLAKSQVPNATYAQALIKANFASVEWDSL